MHPEGRYYTLITSQNLRCVLNSLPLFLCRQCIYFPFIKAIPLSLSLSCYAYFLSYFLFFLSLFSSSTISFVISFFSLRNIFLSSSNKEGLRCPAENYLHCRTATDVQVCHLAHDGFCLQMIGFHWLTDRILI